MADRKTVDVVYAQTLRQYEERVELRDGDTFRSVISRSRLLTVFPELRLEELQIGSYGRMRKLDDPVAEGDRAEILRPVTADPRSVRKRKG